MNHTGDHPADPAATGRVERARLIPHRVFGVSILLVLALLGSAGLNAGPTPARGPDRTMSSELFVDGARQPQAPTRARRTARATRPRGREDTGDASFTVARTPAEVEELRPAWAALQGSRVTSDIDVVLTYVQRAPEAIRPHVVLVDRGGEPVALVVGRVEDRELPTRVGYKTLFAPTLRALTVAYGGVLGPTDTQGARTALDALYNSLQGDDIDLVRLRALELGSPLHTAALEAAPALRRERFGRAVPHWRSRVIGSFDEYLARRKKKVRWQARKDAAELEREFGKNLEVRAFSDPDDLDELFADTAVVHRTTYQQALGVGFTEGEPYRSLTRLGMERGWFRGYVLYLRGRPAAFWHGDAYRGTYGLGATGFDPAHAELRPGGYLLMRLVEDLCADAAVQTLDFGFGDATYKRQLGDESRLEEDVVVFSASAKALSVNLVRSALQGTTAAARAVLERNGQLAGLKRTWRNRLASRPDA